MLDVNMLNSFQLNFLAVLSSKSPSPCDMLSTVVIFLSALSAERPASKIGW